MNELLINTKCLNVISSQTVLGKEFTVYGTAEDPLFLAKDVAEWIEHTDVSTMLRSVDEDEKLIQTMFVSGQSRECAFVTEDGLYEVLMLSRKPIAKQFKKEVKKILHQIRLTGSYTVPRTFAEALRLAAEQQEQIALMQPKAEFYDAVTGSSDCIEMKEVAKLLNIKDMGRNKLFEILRNKKVLDRNNQPYQKFVDAGLFRVVESKYCVNGDVRINLKTVVFQKGIDFIKKVVEENNF